MLPIALDSLALSTGGGLPSAKVKSSMPWQMDPFCGGCREGTRLDVIVKKKKFKLKSWQPQAPQKCKLSDDESTDVRLFKVHEILPIGVGLLL